MLGFGVRGGESALVQLEGLKLMLTQPSISQSFVEPTSLGETIKGISDERSRGQVNPSCLFLIVIVASLVSVCLSQGGPLASSSVVLLLNQ